MVKKINVSVVGGSGYAGGELLRLLLFHPNVNLQQVTSNSFAGKKISAAHPNLRKITEIGFCKPEELKECDLLFLATPHGFAMNHIQEFRKKAKRIILES